MATGGGSSVPCEAPESVAVFIDSNLGTHLAMLVSTAETVADLKRSVSAEHALCFPHIGEITVQAVKVKRKGAYYHLSDSMLVRSAFYGAKGAWFLHVDLVVREIKHQEQAAGNFVNENEWLEGDHQLRSGLLQIVIADGSQGINMQLDGKDISRNDAAEAHVTHDVELPHHIHTEELRHDVFGTNNSELDKKMEVQEPKCQNEGLEVPCPMPKDELIVEHEANKDKRYDSEVPNIGTNNASDSAGPGMKEISTTRIEVSQHNNMMDRNSPHTSFERKLGKNRKGGSHEDANQECRTVHGIQSAPSGTETSKLDMMPLKVNGKNGASLAGEPKKKRKKRTSKSQNEASSTIPSGSVIDFPETKVKHNAETGLSSHSLGETEFTVHAEDAFIETNHQDLVGQSKDLTEESGFAAGKIMRDVANGDSMGIISNIISVGKSDTSSPVCQIFAESRLSNNASEAKSQTLEAVKFEELIPKGKHKEANATVDTNKEYILTAAAEVGSGVQSESTIEKKKRRKKSSKTSASTTLVLHDYDSVPEEKNLKEVPRSGKNSVLNAVDRENIKGEIYSSNYYAQLDTKDPLGSMKGDHISEIKEHENVESTNLQSDDLTINYSLKDQDNEENCKEKLEDKGLQGHASLGEMGAMHNTMAMDSVVATITKVKKSHKKKKRSSTAELINDDSTNHQEFVQPLVKGTDDERIQVMNLKPNLPDKEPKLVSSVGEALTTVYPANEDLTINSKVDSKSSRGRKRKSVKLNVLDGMPYNGLDKKDTPGSLLKASETLNDPFGREANIPSGSVQDVTEVNAFSSFSNLTNNDNGGKKEELERVEVDLPSQIAGSTTCKFSAEPLEANINFKDYFMPKSVQHEPVISAPQLSSEEAEPSKQHEHKSERKRKLDIKSQDLNRLQNSKKECMLEPDPEDHHHDLNLVDPFIQSSIRLTNSEKSQNDSVERTSNSSMHIDISYDKVKKKKKVENYKHDSRHKISSSQDKQTQKIVQHQIPSPQKYQPEKIAPSENDKSLKKQDNNDTKVLKYHGQRHAKSNSVTRNTELHMHASQDISSYATDSLQEDAVANLAASSDSTEETPMPARRFTMAIGKKTASKSTATSNKSKQEKMPLPSSGTIFDNDTYSPKNQFENNRTASQVRKKPTSKFTTTSSKSKQEKTLLAPSGTIFSHATTYSSEDEFENGRTPSPDSSSTSVNSDQGLDSLTADADSAAFRKKDEIDGEILLSQSRKGMPLDSILRSSSIYKKAKVLASQSQAEDSESQPEAAVSS